MKFSYRIIFISTLVTGLLSVACGGSSSASGAGSRAACKTQQDCAGNETCVGLGEQGECRIQCTASANECSGEASCSGIGGVSLDVCKPKEEEASGGSGGSSSSSEKPEDVWLRCASDADCDKVQSGAVCSPYHGILLCTIPCGSDTECNPPTVGGISTRFVECAVDSTKTERRVCLPRDECFSDPQSCIELPNGNPDGTGGTDGTGSGGQGSGGNDGTGGDPFGTGGSDPFGTGGDFEF